MKKGPRKRQDLQDILKVLKYNQDQSKHLLDEAASLQSTMDVENTKHRAFLDQMDRLLGIDSSLVMPEPASVSSQSTEFVPYFSFDELLQRANMSIPDEVTIHQILTSAEVEAAKKHVDEIYDEFSRQTHLTHVDIAFLSVAVALQALRQYVIGPWLSAHRPAAGPGDEAGRKNNADPGWYRVETDKIPTIRVPFDVQRYSNYSTVQGFLKGAGNHRITTLGHDPLLGWVFGTVNILTSTITVSNLSTAHVKQQGNTNVIYALASTKKAGKVCADRFLHEGSDGKIAVGLALLREAQHLKSDINTKLSLPIPVVSTISPKLADNLSRYGIDIARVGTEMGLSVAINLLISMVHRLFFDERIDDRRLFEVRTRKLLLYSNCIASSSNIVVSAIKRDLRVLDVGGLITTIGRLFNDIGFMARVKQEFIDSRMAEALQGTESEIDRMYLKKFSLV